MLEETRRAVEIADGVVVLVVIIVGGDEVVVVVTGLCTDDEDDDGEGASCLDASDPSLSDPFTVVGGDATSRSTLSPLTSLPSRSCLIPNLLIHGANNLIVPCCANVVSRLSIR